MTAQNTERDRMEELLAEHALSGLSAEDAAVLAELEAGEHDESYELAAAALELALVDHEQASPPAEVMERIKAGVLAHAAASRTATGRTQDAVEEEAPAPLAVLFRALPWLAAAAAIALAAVAWMPARTPSFSDQRVALLESPGVMTVAWQALEDPAAAGYTDGDVVWSDALQQGYMRFVGLEPNDPLKEQYQLWIFDASRSADHPVDGGVFNVNEAGEVIVPIDAKIRVNQASMFAITVERPGGVVVSDRSRLPLLAQPAG